MRTFVLQLTDTYLLHFTLTDTGTYRTVRIDSQWTGAKDPGGLQTKYQFTLDRDQYDQLINFLKECEHGSAQPVQG
jgi:hypothetical protein